MVVYKKEEIAGSRKGCYPTLASLYSIIPRDVRLHMERVGVYGDLFYQHLYKNHPDYVREIDSDFITYAKDLFTLHDIGRAFVPVRFQNKAGGLTDEEYAQIKQHTTLTGTTLESIYHLPFSQRKMDYLADIALFHHERWDGTGYPFGSSEDAIPLVARICSVVDAYDGMTSWKAYRQPMQLELVKKIILEEAGRQFQPELAQAFVECIGRMPQNMGAQWEAQAGRYYNNEEDNL